MTKRKIYSDMAVEFAKQSAHYNVGDLRYCEVEVDERMSAKIHKPCGRYVTVETDAVKHGEIDKYSRVSETLADFLIKFVGQHKSVMAVGLGNPDLTADALGDRVFKRLRVNRHYTDESSYLCALTPNVLGMTGIESFDIINAVCKSVKPDAIVAVDALTAASSTRIASAFQVTDSGITPGSGVENHRRRLDLASLGVPVVSIGVPLVVYASTIALDYCDCTRRVSGDMIVTPKDVDVYVGDCARIIANAINAAFG